MDLGAFSVSLNVKNIEASRDFYAKLGFEPVGGNAAATRWNNQPGTSLRPTLRWALIDCSPGAW